MIIYKKLTEAERDTFIEMSFNKIKSLFDPELIPLCFGREGMFCF